MVEIPNDVKSFFDSQHFLIVSSFDGEGNIHTSCKGVIDIDIKGKIIILDNYKARTYKNIKRDPRVALTAVDDHKFKGYSVVGQARILREDSVSKSKLDIWHDKLSKRIAKRVIKHVKGDPGGHDGIPEARFPLPKYVIEVSVNKVISLAPSK